MSTNLGNWELDGAVLRPKLEEMQSFCMSLSTQRGQDPLVTFHFADSATSEPPLQIQRSLLISCGGPLASLVSAPFLEARENVVNMPCESRASFEVVRQLLYCLPVDLATASADIPIVADRWDLGVLFDAYFLVLEKRDLDICQLCKASLPAMATVQVVPAQFKKYFTHRFSSEFSDVQRWLGDDIWRDDGFEISVKMNSQEENTTEEDEDTTGVNPTFFAEGRNHDIAMFPGSVYEDNTGVHHSERAHSEPGNDGCSVESKSSDAIDETPGISELRGPHIAAELHASQACSASYWSGQTALIHAKRNLWNVLMFQGLVPQIIRHIAIFSSTNLTEQLLDIVLRQLEGKLSDEETIIALRAFDWDSTESSAALQSTVAEKWSGNAWRLLARSQTSAIRRGCDTVSYRWTMRGFHGRLPELRTGTYWYKEIDYKRCKFRIRMGKPSSKKCDSRGFPYLVLTVTVLNGEDVPPYYLSRRVTVKLNVIGTYCGCRDETHKTERIGQPFEGQNMDNLTISSFLKPNKVHILLMAPKEFERFLDVHKPSCGIVMKLRVRIDDYKTRSDPINDELGGESVSGEDKSGVYQPDSRVQERSSD